MYFNHQSVLEFFWCKYDKYDNKICLFNVEMQHYVKNTVISLHFAIEILKQ